MPSAKQVSIEPRWRLEISVTDTVADFTPPRQAGPQEVGRDSDLPGNGINQVGDRAVPKRMSRMEFSNA
jgi:hypothetical protein